MRNIYIVFISLYNNKQCDLKQLRDWTCIEYSLEKKLFTSSLSHCIRHLVSIATGGNYNF